MSYYTSIFLLLLSFYSTVNPSKYAGGLTVFTVPELMVAIIFLILKPQKYL
jgi:hypothetical protein